ncbi:putative Ca2+/H+ antiporter (TMEM165/GDT1 family) [Rhizobium sp. BK591]|uniref:hypothetical protein n=1 Tax=Rhizobium sp. BK591 TaxID=2586985 RepID=UPI00104ADE5F|nr:hypothetical protein [Rhizobium sp. BK591]MBB3747429.1 putative Ca2+/H+ antiporter (TMEM165/GDT1 family) [Rhizobium sp. BK591]
MIDFLMYPAAMKSRRITAEFAMSALAVAIGGLWARGRIVPEATVDFAMFCGFVVLLAWLIWPSSKGENE